MFPFDFFFGFSNPLETLGAGLMLLCVWMFAVGGELCQLICRCHSMHSVVVLVIFICNAYWLTHMLLVWLTKIGCAYVKRFLEAASPARLACPTS